MLSNATRSCIANSETWIGFAHQYKPLDPEDIPAVLAHYWHQLGLPDTDVDPDSEVVGTIIHITGGNFRLIERLMTQVGRLMDINSFESSWFCWRPGFTQLPRFGSWSDGTAARR